MTIGPVGAPGTLLVRILLVEDDEDDIQVVTDLLGRAERTEFAITLARNADQGLAQLAAEPFDLCLVDFRLPGRDGLELIRAARDLAGGAVMVLMSGQSDPRLDLDTIEAGVADYLDKDELDVVRLERCLRFALARRGHDAGHRRAAQFAAVDAADPDAGGADLRSSTIAAALSDAIEQNGIELLFQPQLRLASRALVLAACFRWPRPEGETISQEKLVTLAAATGLTTPLANRMLDAVLRQAAIWHRLYVGPSCIALPVLHAPALVAGLPGALAALETDPGGIELEIPEPLALADIDSGGHGLTALHACGVRLALAGFGRGPTSLRSLRDPRFRTVKLAASLLRAADGGGDFALATIGYARALGLRVVVEDSDVGPSLEAMHAAGCDAIQSSTLCAPLTAEACTAWLRRTASGG